MSEHKNSSVELHNEFKGNEVHWCVYCLFAWIMFGICSTFSGILAAYFPALQDYSYFKACYIAVKLVLP